MSNTREKLFEMNKVLCNSLHCDYDEMQDAMCIDTLLTAENLIANGVTVQEWIPVNDPPKKDGRYLVAKKIFNKIIRQEVLSFAKDGRKVDKYDFHRGWKNVWYRYDGEWGYLTIDDVTHWMPLPEPPKGE